MKSITLASLFLFTTLAHAALPSIYTKGNRFFTSNGDRFFAIGVDYEPSGAAKGDPIYDVAGLTRDIPYFKQLGLNCIRVYTSDASLDHTQGMKMLSDAGIYVLIDTTSSNNSIASDNPAWNLDIFSGMKAKIDAFASFDNVLGFLAGNEVYYNESIPAQRGTLPFVKAAVRDVKSYLKSKNSSILVGYAAVDFALDDHYVRDFLDCGNVSTSVDFYGINTYRWCGDATGNPYAGYAVQFGIPLILTEYGCVQGTAARPFNEVKAIYQDMANDYLSGGFAFQYTNEAVGFGAGHGLVQINANNTVTVLQDFNNLKDKLAAFPPAKSTASGYTPSSPTLMPCNNTFVYDATVLPPPADSVVCQNLYNSLTCVFKSNASPGAISGATSTACGTSGVSCSPIIQNSSTNTYGSWSSCLKIQQSAYAIDAYYKAKVSSGGTCNFGGAAQTQSPTTTPVSTQPATASDKSSISSSTTSSSTTSSTASPVKSTTRNSASAISTITVLISSAIFVIATI